jgi:hypothetical protein
MMAQIDGNAIKYPEDVAYDQLVEDYLHGFEFIGTNEEDIDIVFYENTYLRDLYAMSGLEISQRSKVLKAFKKSRKSTL